MAIEPGKAFRITVNVSAEQAAWLLPMLHARYGDDAVTEEHDPALKHSDEWVLAEFFVSVVHSEHRDYAIKSAVRQANIQPLELAVTVEGAP